ncbi:hypothetical protein KJ980_08310 [Patescibacteria group bacterium]|nr:hypothetical protein [Patescibacteria group bacterium]MBU4017029.1 hypothetical protein [Patescibacteria group bacterium]MBU4099618.1 hypothetical protein [Patescibacteria group bacterium]
MLTAKSIDQNNYDFLYYGERDRAFFEAVDALKNNYDGGKILITRSISDVFVNSIDTDIFNLIQESNYIYWQKTLEKPWLYARYIVMFNPKIGGWAKERDEISKKWFGKEEIYAFYNVVLNNNRYTILKINEDKLREYAWENNLNIKELPSINTSLTNWQPDEQERRIGIVQTNSINDLTSKAILSLSWKDYKKDYITNQGRVVTSDIERPTTSEGQSYALLRAIYINDKQTFDNVLLWTINSLSLSDRNLFAWLYGYKNNNIGIVDKGTATDADQDIALALLFASNKWHDSEYLDLAKLIISDIWKYETVEVNGKRFIVAGDWASAKNNKIYTINPSYLSPYTYRMFAEVDKEHDWDQIVNTSYELLDKCTSLHIDSNTSANIPPDWCAIDKNGNVLIAENINGKASSYSYDAIRTLWRIALDYTWYKDSRALNYLQRMTIWPKEWTEKQKIYSTYTHDGKMVNNEESLSHYGTQLAFFTITDKKIADEIYKKKILSQWNKEGYWGDKNNYYDQNWVWFGTALYTNNLSNLWVNKK